MMNENNRNNEMLLDVPSKLREARNIKSVPDELHDFCDYLADVSDQEAIPESMIMLLHCALDDLEREKCGFPKRIPFPETLKEEKYQIVTYLRYFPLIVDKIANKEFAEEFREIFTEVFGEAQPPEDNLLETCGVKIIRRGLVDISTKDKAEVLAALYNSAHPQGIGIFQYDPKPMSIEEARDLLKEKTYFERLLGRGMKIDLESNEVPTLGYNMYYGEGAAERVISQCRNVR